MIRRLINFWFLMVFMLSALPGIAFTPNLDQFTTEIYKETRQGQQLLHANDQLSVMNASKDSKCDHDKEHIENSSASCNDKCCSDDCQCVNGCYKAQTMFFPADKYYTPIQVNGTFPVADRYFDHSVVHLHNRPPKN